MEKHSEDQVYVIVIWTLGCPICLAVSCQTINPATARFMSAALDDEFEYFENDGRFAWISAKHVFFCHK